MIDALFGVKHETRCLVEIMDIQDELTMVKAVLTQQKDVLNHLAKWYPKTANEENEGRSKKDGSATEPVTANVDQQAVQNPNANEGATQPQPEGDAEGREIKEGYGNEIEEEVRELSAVKEDEPAAIPGIPAQPSTTETLVSESQSQLSTNETSILKSRSLLGEAIDLVDGNIKSVDHMLQHARKVQKEV